MIFLKKFSAILLAFSIFLLSGCAQKDLIDIYTFSERFSGYSENFEIDTKNLLAKEEEENLKFPLTFSDRFLLTVSVNQKTSLVSSLSLTYAFAEGRKISDEDFCSFLEIAESAAKSFTNQKETDKIFSEIGLETKADVLSDNHNSAEDGFYNFSFLSNEVGFCFIVSTDRR